MQNEQNDTNNPSNLAATAKTGFGDTLRQARNQKNVTLDDAAKETFILKRHLQALENEDFDALPQLAFAKGFASNYAKYLGLDSAAISQQFESIYPAHLQPKTTAEIRSPLQPMGTLNRESRGGIKINLFLVAGIIGALGLGVYIFKTVNKAHTDTQPIAPASATQGMNPNDKAVGASLSNTGSAITSSTASLNGALPSAGSAIGTATNPVTATTQLEVLVKDATTVNITDATGKALLQGEQTRGSYKVSGQPPFNVVIDNVKNVNLDMNKQPIKLTDYTQTNQANFTLK